MQPLHHTQKRKYPSSENERKTHKNTIRVKRVRAERKRKETILSADILARLAVTQDIRGRHCWCLRLRNGKNTQDPQTHCECDMSEVGARECWVLRLLALLFFQILKGVCLSLSFLLPCECSSYKPKRHTTKYREGCGASNSAKGISTSFV